MRIKIILLSLLIPYQAFCAKNFFCGPNEKELHFAYLVIAIASLVSFLFHFLFYRTKWLAIMILNIILMIAFVGIAFIGLLFSPPASLFGLILVVTSFVLSFKKNNKRRNEIQEI